MSYYHTLAIRYHFNTREQQAWVSPRCPSNNQCPVLIPMIWGWFNKTLIDLQKLMFWTSRLFSACVCIRFIYPPISSSSIHHPQGEWFHSPCQTYHSADIAQGEPRHGSLQVESITYRYILRYRAMKHRGLHAKVSVSLIITTIHLLTSNFILRNPIQGRFPTIGVNLEVSLNHLGVHPCWIYSIHSNLEEWLPSPNMSVASLF